MPKTQHLECRSCPGPQSLQQAGSPLLCRGKKLVMPWKNVHHSKAARMYPGMNLPDPFVSLNDSLDTPVFSSFNRFSILPEECLFSLTLSPILSSSRKSFYRRLHSQSHLRSALKISCLAVFSPSSPCFSSLSDTDLGSEEPLTLPVIVNDSLSASLLIYSSTSSQFIDVDYVECKSLKMTPET